MKRIILIILLIAMGLIGYQYFRSEVIAYDVTEVMHKNTEAGAEVLVTGLVSQNFNILGKGGYQLQDRNTGESIYVCKDGASPQIGEVMTIRVKKLDIVTFNDRKLSFYQELDE